MSGSNGVMSPGGYLEAELIKASKKHPRKAFHFKVPGLGRMYFTRDQGESMLFGGNYLVSRLGAEHRDARGKLVKRYDFGSGLTTYGLALGLANEWVSNTNAACLKTFQYMTSGTGTTTAASQDFQLQTQSGPVTGAVTPTVGVGSGNSTGTLQWVGTIAYTTTLAITEWGLFAGGGLYGVPAGFTNTSTDTFTSATATPGTSQTWTAHAYAGEYIVQVASGTSVIGFRYRQQCHSTDHFSRLA